MKKIIIPVMALVGLLTSGSGCKSENDDVETHELDLNFINTCEGEMTRERAMNLPPNYPLVQPRNYGNDEGSLRDNELDSPIKFEGFLINGEYYFMTYYEYRFMEYGSETLQNNLSARIHNCLGEFLGEITLNRLDRSERTTFTEYYEYKSFSGGVKADNTLEWGYYEYLEIPVKTPEINETIARVLVMIDNQEYLWSVDF